MKRLRSILAAPFYAVAMLCYAALLAAAFAGSKVEGKP